MFDYPYVFEVSKYIMIIMIYSNTLLSFLVIFTIGILSLYYTIIYEKSHALRFRPNLLTILSITSISTVVTSVMTLYNCYRHTTIRTMLVVLLLLVLHLALWVLFHKLSLQFQHCNFCLFLFVYQ